MVVVVGNLSEQSKAERDSQRSRSSLPRFPVNGLVLFKVRSATAISGQDARWTYSLDRVVVQPSSSSYLTTASQTTARYTGISLSELSNALTFYSYGVQEGNIPTGFAAVRIPNNAIVAAFPLYMTDGDTMWIIVNTQAIDGQCSASLTDGGEYFGEA